MNNHDENDKYEQAYQVIKELNSHGLNDLYTVIKGIALNRVLYHENQIRSFNDLDIFVPRIGRNVLMDIRGDHGDPPGKIDQGADPSGSDLTGSDDQDMLFRQIQKNGKK